jgi:hypothetical protein
MVISSLIKVLPLIKEKIEAMLHWPVPTNLTELRGFLSLTGCNQKFMKNYGIFAKQLTSLLKQHKLFVWTEQAQLAFDRMEITMFETYVRRQI